MLYTDFLELEGARHLTCQLIVENHCTSCENMAEAFSLNRIIKAWCQLFIAASQSFSVVLLYSAMLYGMVMMLTVLVSSYQFTSAPRDWLINRRVRRCVC
jgi:hypothetical protein